MSLNWNDVAVVLEGAFPGRWSEVPSNVHVEGDHCVSIDLWHLTIRVSFYAPNTTTNFPSGGRVLVGLSSGGRRRNATIFTLKEKAPNDLPVYVETTKFADVDTLREILEELKLTLMGVAAGILHLLDGEALIPPDVDPGVRAMFSPEIGPALDTLLEDETEDDDDPLAALFS